MSRPNWIMQQIRKDVRFAPDAAFDPKCPPEKSGFFKQNEANIPYRFPGKKGAYRTYARFIANLDFFSVFQKNATHKNGLRQPGCCLEETVQCFPGMIRLFFELSAKNTPNFVINPDLDFPGLF